MLRFRVDQGIAAVTLLSFSPFLLPAAEGESEGVRFRPRLNAVSLYFHTAGCISACLMPCTSWRYAPCVTDVLPRQSARRRRYESHGSDAVLIDRGVPLLWSVCVRRRHFHGGPSGDSGQSLRRTRLPAPPSEGHRPPPRSTWPAPGGGERGGSFASYCEGVAHREVQRGRRASARWQGGDSPGEWLGLGKQVWGISTT